MIGYISKAAASHKSIFWILLCGFIVQVITSVTQIGVSSADQHFQIIEFSLNQLGKPNGAVQVWEYDHYVRPTLQVYMFSAYHLLCNSLGITDPYAQLTILRVVLGIVMWLVFNLLVFRFLRNATARVFIVGLLLVNFSWALPYTRTLFSSEMMSSLFFFGALLMYDYFKDKKPSFLLLAIVGFVFCLSFYFRFQAAFALVGVGIWILFFERKISHALPMLAGFALGFGLNVLLDYYYYNELVITPYTYFYVNIIDGRADYFGRSSFLRYIALIILVTPAPLFSFVLFLFLLRVSVSRYRDVIVLSTLLFVIFHSMVGHKEERFLFPIFNALPVIAAYSVPYVERLFNTPRKWIGAFFALLLGTTVFLNVLFLFILCVVPYSQTIAFSKKLSNHFKRKEASLFCIAQTPFETPSGNQMEFYKIASRNIRVEKIKRYDGQIIAATRPIYLAVAFNDVKDHFEELEQLGYRPVLSSSNLLWSVNEFLHERKVNTINEIWRLYELGDAH
jgi:GPI mannosyltransferase 3